MWKTNETRIAGISCISISSKEDCFVVGFDNNDVAVFDLSQIVPTSYETFDVGTKGSKEK